MVLLLRVVTIKDARTGEERRRFDYSEIIAYSPSLEGVRDEVRRKQILIPFRRFKLLFVFHL